MPDPSRLALLLDGFDAEIQAARAHLETKGGQTCTPTGDFIQCPPSTIKRLEWWSREFRRAAGLDGFHLLDVDGATVRSDDG